MSLAVQASNIVGLSSSLPERIATVRPLNRVTGVVKQILAPIDSYNTHVRDPLTDKLAQVCVSTGRKLCSPQLLDIDLFSYAFEKSSLNLVDSILKTTLEKLENLPNHFEDRNSQMACEALLGFLKLAGKPVKIPSNMERLKRSRIVRTGKKFYVGIESGVIRIVSAMTGPCRRRKPILTPAVQEAPVAQGWGSWIAGGVGTAVLGVANVALSGFAMIARGIDKVEKTPKQIKHELVKKYIEPQIRNLSVLVVQKRLKSILCMTHDAFAAPAILGVSTTFAGTWATHLNRTASAVQLTSYAYATVPLAYSTIKTLRSACQRRDQVEAIQRALPPEVKDYLQKEYHLSEDTYNKISNAVMFGLVDSTMEILSRMNPGLHAKAEQLLADPKAVMKLAKLIAKQINTGIKLRKALTEET